MSVEFILNPSVEVRRVMVVDSVDFGVWMTVVERERGDNEGDGTSMRTTRVLVLGANMNESEVMIELDRLGVGVGGQVEQVLDSGAKLVVDQDEGEGEGEDKKKTKMRLMFTPLGSGGWIFDF